MILNSQYLQSTIRTIVSSNGQCRHISTYLDKNYSSKAIRQSFLNYFVKEHGHNFVRSSPVVPFCDPTVAFVNAGMNQFKGILLGTHTSEHSKVANYQKCIRVGGKHNDLSVVGTDGYHHTFFEMLGSWSFGNYFKREACQLAWDLLTKHYKLNKGTLYVTYFSGDKELSLEPDLECKEIWRSIGVADERILPYGLKDNFWEMGPTGPCGPCTEIHVDLRGTDCRSAFVNKGLPDLTELWNIVFIQFNRKFDGKIEPLSSKHVDTGMGFERLTAILQGKLSNYDTDLFTNLFSAIYKISKRVPMYGGKFGEKDWNCLDTNYRILADHSRMITACLADGMIPEQNQKLRKVMRKAFAVCESGFKNDKGLMKELTNYVVESLGHAYPEMERNIKQVHQIIEYEEDVYQSLRKTSSFEWNRIVSEEPRLKVLDVIEMPGVVAAYKNIHSSGIKRITPEFGFKLYDTFGLDEENIVKLSESLSLPFDREGFKEELEKAKGRSRNIGSSSETLKLKQLLRTLTIPTDDSHKYSYKRLENGNYDFRNLNVNVLLIIDDAHKRAALLRPNQEYTLVLDKTNLYTEAGGQSNDTGALSLSESSKFSIENVQKVGNFILHKGKFVSELPLEVGENLTGTLTLDVGRRFKKMQNHTATHLLNCALKKTKGVTCQKSSKIEENLLNLDVGVFGSKLSASEVCLVEKLVNDVIKEKVDVSTKVVDSLTLNAESDITLIPGEIYPDEGIRLVEIVSSVGLVSKEPCCGTHVKNTGDLKQFSIVEMRSIGRSTTSLTAFTGLDAEQVEQNGQKQVEAIESLEKELNNEPELLETKVAQLRHSLTQYYLNLDKALPVVARVKCLRLLDDMRSKIKKNTKRNLKEFIESEMKKAIERNLRRSKSNCAFVVHRLESSVSLDKASLQKATTLCKDVPVLIVSCTDNVLTARCCVPKDYCNSEFDARKWLQRSVSDVFHISITPSKNQDLVCDIKSRKMNSGDVEVLLDRSLKIAKDYAERCL